MDLKIEDDEKQKESLHYIVANPEFLRQESENFYSKLTFEISNLEKKDI